MVSRFLPPLYYITTTSIISWCRMQNGWGAERERVAHDVTGRLISKHLLCLQASTSTTRRSSPAARRGTSGSARPGTGWPGESVAWVNNTYDNSVSDQKMFESFQKLFFSIAVTNHTTVVVKTRNLVLFLSYLNDVFLRTLYLLFPLLPGSRARRRRCAR